jgi:hypothetical protein
MHGNWGDVAPSPRHEESALKGEQRCSAWPLLLEEARDGDLVVSRRSVR